MCKHDLQSKNQNTSKLTCISPLCLFDDLLEASEYYGSKHTDEEQNLLQRRVNNSIVSSNQKSAFYEVNFKVRNLPLLLLYLSLSILYEYFTNCQFWEILYRKVIILVHNLEDLHSSQSGNQHYQETKQSNQKSNLLLEYVILKVQEKDENTLMSCNLDLKSQKVHFKFIKHSLGQTLEQETSFTNFFEDLLEQALLSPPGQFIHLVLFIILRINVSGKNPASSKMESNLQSAKINSESNFYPSMLPL